jgi:hypothetical protein
LNKRFQQQLAAAIAGVQNKLPDPQKLNETAAQNRSSADKFKASSARQPWWKRLGSFLLRAFTWCFTSRAALHSSSAIPTRTENAANIKGAAQVAADMAKSTSQSNDAGRGA